MKKITYIIVLIISTSCGSYDLKQKSLKYSKGLNQSFEKKEINDLYKILNFFDNQIMSSFKSKSMIESYDLFNVKDLELKDEGLIFGNIPFSKQKELYSSINKSTFNEIWNLGKSFKENGRESSIVFIRTDGKYANYLQELGLKNNFIKIYIETIKNYNDIPPPLFYTITENYKNFDITDENIRLMIAIHYLTLNDNFHE
ncbi:MAG: hypothetical protein KAH72_00555 [Flavobacteriaceae bacterium]|nr:hypothetical protein [Flavobacteriaceae bacterium]